MSGRRTPGAAGWEAEASAAGYDIDPPEIGMPLVDEDTARWVLNHAAYRVTDCVWERVPSDATHYPRGGHVWAVTAEGDPSTGSVEPHYYCAQVWRGRVVWCRLAELEVGEGGPSVAVMSTIRGIAGVIAARRGSWRAQDDRLHDALTRLVAKVSERAARDHLAREANR